MRIFATASQEVRGKAFMWRTTFRPVFLAFFHTCCRSCMYFCGDILLIHNCGNQLVNL
nr:MAG TPA: tetratricopeptide repeat protein [Caudoviricetes sp.]